MNEPLQLGRYTLVTEIASGGMATVYVGRLSGDVGFGRTVAIKRLHRHLKAEPEFVAMFLDEARLAARVQHPNVVATLDVVEQDRELFVVMEYVRGESLGALLKATRDAGTTIPVPVVTAVAIGFLNGLHAAHEATSEQGEPLSIIHRDVSPQNVLVGADGVARVLDFGVAKAAMRIHATRDGQMKGKVAYMAPEQVVGEVTRRTDIYSAGVVLWEALTCRRLFQGETEAQLLRKVTEASVKEPSRHNAEVTPEIDRVVMKALAKEPSDRYATAHEMASELDAALRPASAMRVGEWVQVTGGDALAERTRLVTELESNSLPRSRPSPSNRPPSPPEDEPTAVVVSPSREPSFDTEAEPPASRSRAGAPFGVGAAVAVIVLTLLLAGVGVLSYVAIVRDVGPPVAALPMPPAVPPLPATSETPTGPEPTASPLPPPPASAMNVAPDAAASATRKVGRPQPHGKGGAPPLNVFSGPRK